MKSRVTMDTAHNTERDRFYIDLALNLAVRGEGQVKPNPLVGAVIVNDAKIVGQGFHLYDKIKHAEVLALEQAGSLAIGATVYVNLEPCCQRGGGKRNPPCVDALIVACVKRVVCCIPDPNPRVSGRGFDALRDAGITVSIGLRANAARKLNHEYLSLITLSEMPPTLDRSQTTNPSRSLITARIAQS